MADTRCVDPEYQLDVDVMMLEYLLHHAIQAQLRALQQLSASGQNGTRDFALHDSKNRLSDAKKLTRAFDGMFESLLPSLIT